MSFRLTTSVPDTDTPGAGYAPIFGRPVSERSRPGKRGTRIVHWQSLWQRIGRPEADSIRQGSSVICANSWRRPRL